jgi:hypothetical protein
MIDRDKVLAILARRFPATPADQLAAAANAIVGLEDDWQELASHVSEIGVFSSEGCSEACAVADAARRGISFRVFTKRSDGSKVR